MSLSTPLPRVYSLEQLELEIEMLREHGFIVDTPESSEITRELDPSSSSHPLPQQHHFRKPRDASSPLLVHALDCISLSTTSTPVVSATSSPTQLVSESDTDKRENRSEGHAGGVGVGEVLHASLPLPSSSSPSSSPTVHPPTNPLVVVSRDDPTSLLLRRTSMIVLPEVAPHEKANVQVFSLFDDDVCIVIHGGAGVINPNSFSPLEEKYRNSLNEALSCGLEVLTNGGVAVDAVLHAVRSLESCELYNAGRGAVFNAEGRHELEACIADGRTGNFGSCAILSNVEHPVGLARSLLELNQRIFIAGPGAEQTAAHRGLPLVENSFFDTDLRKDQWLQARGLKTVTLDHGSGPSKPIRVSHNPYSLKIPLPSDVQGPIIAQVQDPNKLVSLIFPRTRSEMSSADFSSSNESDSDDELLVSKSSSNEMDTLSEPCAINLSERFKDESHSSSSNSTSDGYVLGSVESEEKFGTVGAVAIDRYGNVAAATSTGGLTNKPVGRIGDSSILGHSTWARNGSCAVSTTGVGEFFMQNCLAHDLHARMVYGNQSLSEAMKTVLTFTMPESSAGIIGIDAIRREVCLGRNTLGMFRGFATKQTRAEFIWEK